MLFVQINLVDSRAKLWPATPLSMSSFHEIYLDLIQGIKLSVKW